MYSSLLFVILRLSLRLGPYWINVFNYFRQNLWMDIKREIEFCMFMTMKIIITLTPIYNNIWNNLGFNANDWLEYHLFGRGTIRLLKGVVIKIALAVVSRSGTCLLFASFLDLTRLSTTCHDALHDVNMCWSKFYFYIYLNNFICPSLIQNPDNPILFILFCFSLSLPIVTISKSTWFTNYIV